MTLVGQIVFCVAWAFAIVALVVLAAGGVFRDKDREEAHRPDKADMDHGEERK